MTPGTDTYTASCSGTNHGKSGILFFLRKVTEDKMLAFDKIGDPQKTHGRSLLIEELRGQLTPIIHVWSLLYFEGCVLGYGTSLCPDKGVIKEEN